jgi:hypothetical protein
MLTNSTSNGSILTIFLERNKKVYKEYGDLKVI